MSVLLMNKVLLRCSKKSVYLLFIGGSQLFHQIKISGGSEAVCWHKTHYNWLILLSLIWWILLIRVINNPDVLTDWHQQKVRWHPQVVSHQQFRSRYMVHPQGALSHCWHLCTGELSDKLRYWSAAIRKSLCQPELKPQCHQQYKVSR